MEFKEWWEQVDAYGLGLPEGYVLVPVEPTEKMLGASGSWNKGDAYSYYKSMIIASQEEE